VSDFKKQIEDCLDLMRIQGNEGNWDYDPYMHGMYNGMELILAVFEKREPVFREAPEVWRKDIVMNLKPVSWTDSGRHIGIDQESRGNHGVNW
jgi:hypothetical protein